jgi:hypothetical protein
MGKSAVGAILAAVALGGYLVAAQALPSDALVCSCTDWQLFSTVRALVYLLKEIKSLVSQCPSTFQ